MSIQLPQKPEDLAILQTEVKAIAGLLAQQESINDAIKNRAKSVEEAIEGIKSADVKKLSKVYYLENAEELVSEAIGLQKAVEGLFEGEDSATSA